jgi:hypothetical protein
MCSRFGMRAASISRCCEGRRVNGAPSLPHGAGGGSEELLGGEKGFGASGRLASLLVAWPPGKTFPSRMQGCTNGGLP